MVTDGAPEDSTDCVAGRRKPPMPRPGVCARGRSALVREAEHSTMDRTGRTAYDRVVVNVPQVAQEAIDAAVESALSQVLHTDLGDRTHLARAVIADRIAAVAKHRSRDEVAAAIDLDGRSWDEIAHAFGISPHDAHERFRTAPMGLPE